MPEKISTFQNKKWIFGHFCDFGKITKMAKNPFFYFERWRFFLPHLNHLGRLKFFILYTFWFYQKMGKIKKDTFAHGQFFHFLAQKYQKYQFSWKNLFLTIFLWVISVKKGFLYFWWTPIFEPARVILLRRVRYQPFRLKFLYPLQQNGSSRFKYWCLSKV